MARARRPGQKPVPVTSSPAPTSADAGGDAALVGRQAELATLRETLASVRRGTSRTMLLDGEAGIGKSRLLREAMAMARSQGFAVSSADCLIEPGAPPFDAWIRMLRRVGRGEAAYLLEGTLSGDRSTPYSSWSSRKLSADEAQFRLMSEVLAALERESAKHPLLLCIDDLHWADAPSSRLFQFLARRLEQSPMALIGALRSEEQSRSAAIVESLTGRHAFTHLVLRPLSAEESRLIIDRMILVDEEQAIALHMHSEGNPFVLEETIRLLNATGIDVQGTLPLPRTVAASIRARIEQLDERDRENLELCAVAGRTFHVDVIAAAGGIAEIDAIAVCDRFCQLAVLQCTELRETRQYQFLHERVRAAVLETIARERLRSYHLRLAESLERLPMIAADPDAIARLATHYRAAGAAERASRYYRQLGQLALRRHAPEQAASAFQMSLEFLPDDVPSPDRGQLLMALGNARLASGKRGAIDAFAQAEQAFLSVRAWRDAAIACDHLAIALADDEQHEAARDAWERGLTWLKSLTYDDIDLDRATILIHLSEVLGPSLGRFDDAMRLQRTALRLLPIGATGDRGRAEASLALGRTLIRMNRLSEAQEVLQDALPAAVKSNDLALAAETESAMATVCYWRGRLRDSRTSTQRREAFAAASGDLRSKRHTSAWLALIESSMGNVDRAERLLDAAERDVSEFDSPEPLAFTRQVRGHLALLRGASSRAFSLMRESLETFLPIGPTTSLWYLGYVARAAFHAGELDELESLRRTCWAMLDAVPTPALPRAGTLSHLALLAVESGDASNSALLLELLEPYGGQLHWHLVDRARAGLAHQLGDDARSRLLLEAAIGQAREQGMSVDLEVALRQLDAVKARPPGRTLWPVAPLSEREIEVLRRVALGQTNRDIAIALGISEKTVRNHLTHILDKLDLDNRTAAAAWAFRHGLA